MNINIYPKKVIKRNINMNSIQKTYIKEEFEISFLKEEDDDDYEEYINEEQDTTPVTTVTTKPKEKVKKKKCVKKKKNHVKKIVNKSELSDYSEEIQPPQPNIYRRKPIRMNKQKNSPIEKNNSYFIAGAIFMLMVVIIGRIIFN